MIAHISGPASVTYYTIPYDLVGRTMLLSNAISTTLFPYLASSIKEEANKAAVATSRILTFLLVPATFIVFAALDPFLRLWIGPEAARSSYGIGQIIIIGVWLNALAVPHNVHLLARGSARLAACILLVQIPFYFLALSYCAKEFGLLGVAFAWTARVLFDSLLQVSACGALRNTLRSVTIPAAFVATGYAIYQILTDDLTISIILALLMAGFVSISWQGFLETINQMKGRQPVIPC